MQSTKNMVSLVGTLSEDPIFKLKTNQRMSAASVILLTSRNASNNSGRDSLGFFEWIPIHFHGQLAHLFNKQNFCKDDRLSIQGELRAYELDKEREGFRVYLVVCALGFKLLNRAKVN